MGRVLVIGLDAVDPALMANLAMAGRAPTFARLVSEGGSSAVVLPDGLFLGVVWPTLTRGVRPGDTTRASWINVDPDTYELAPPDKHHIGGVAVWDHLADTLGTRCLVVDLPHDVPVPSTGVAHVVEWGTHDHEIGMGSTPGSLIDDVMERFGPHPLFGDFPHDGPILFAPDDYAVRAGRQRTPSEDEQLAALMVPGVERSADAKSWLLAEQDWDMAVVCFTEGHSVGHQLWHVHDVDHPRHDPAVRARIGDPVADVYTALDGAVGRLIDEVDDDTDVVVVYTHGMGPMYEATRMLEEILGRLDRWLDVEKGGPKRTARSWAAERLVGGRLRETSMRWAARGVQRRGVWPDESRADVEIDADTRRRRRFFRAWNVDVVGGVRLNLAGREPDGRVSPAEADELLTWVERQLHVLVDVSAGRPLVARTYRCSDMYPDATDRTLPDLFVEWHLASPIDTVWSPTVGVVHVPITHWRTGAHRQRSLVCALGPSIAPGRHAPVPAASIPAGVAGLFGTSLPGATAPAPSWWLPT